jgi:hypothetical protein
MGETYWVFDVEAAEMAVADPPFPVPVMAEAAPALAGALLVTVVLSV